MTGQIRSPSATANRSHRELVAQEMFDYSSLDAEITQQVQTAVHRIRHLVKRTLEDLIAVGNELLAVKMALPHGTFVPWLRAEFGWAERTARNFMTVAVRFGTKTAIIADLSIEPTAAYLLAAPSVPVEASETAVERAERGERITVSVAKEILGNFPRKLTRKSTASVASPSAMQRTQLLEMLESFRQQWDPREIAVLARQLRDFADSLEGK